MMPDVRARPAECGLGHGQPARGAAGEQPFVAELRRQRRTRLAAEGERAAAEQELRLLDSELQAALALISAIEAEQRGQHHAAMAEPARATPGSYAGAEQEPAASAKPLPSPEAAAEISFGEAQVSERLQSSTSSTGGTGLTHATSLASPGEHALLTAARAGDAPGVQELLAGGLLADGPDAMRTARKGHTVLHPASANAHAENTYCVRLFASI